MDSVVRRSPWLIIEAVVLIVLGIAAVLLPFAAGLAVSLIFGLILVLSGAVGVIATFAGGKTVHRGLGLASAIIALAVGLALLFYPIAGAVVVTLLLAAYLLVDGVILIGLSMDHRKRGSLKWRWLLASGVVDVILALALFLLNAVGSTVLLGLFIGVDLVLAGVALLLIHRVSVVDGDVLPAGSPPSPWA